MKEERDHHVFKLALRPHWTESDWGVERWQLNKMKTTWAHRHRRRTCKDEDFLMYVWLRRTPGGRYHWEWNAWLGQYVLWFEQETDAMAFAMTFI
jgi:hypothetical protein